MQAALEKTVSIMKDTDPDPIQSLNEWTRKNFPQLTVLSDDELSQYAGANPAICWRLDDSDEQESLAKDWPAFWRTFFKELVGTFSLSQHSYSVAGYNRRFTAHVLADSLTERLRWCKVLAEIIQLEGKITLTDGSPMLIQDLMGRPAADPFKQGQLWFTGQYGVLAQQPGKEALNSASH